MRECAWCRTPFEPTTTSQIYHSAECRQSATKQRISEQYKTRRRIRKRQALCAGGCGTILSIYNESKFCTVCMVDRKQLRSIMKEIKDIAHGKVH